MSAPIKHTCPDIDKVIKAIKSAIKTCEQAKKNLESEEALDYITDVLYEICDLEGYLEDLRKSNDILRCYGEEMEAENKKLSDILYSLDYKY